MPASTPIELTWPQVHAFRLQRHHLADGAPPRDLARIVGDIGGAQAQVMSAAELQIAVRTQCTVADVRDALWKDRSLVKTWLMRGTLHLARSEDLPVYVGAMGRHWVSQMRPSWLEYMKVTEKEFWSICNDIGTALNGTPMTREELIASVGRGRSAHVNQVLRSGWGSMLKPAARNGLLCFGPSRAQAVTFVSPRSWLPSWREVEPHEALTEMARRHMRVFGPATKKDFSRWWGNWPGVPGAAWRGLAPELTAVSVEGDRREALTADIAEIKKAKVDRQVQLLPLFDPYLMGYATRDHLVDGANAARVSRTAGWISAVVLVEGRVAGTWTHVLANGRLRIDVEPFGKLTRPVVSGIRERAAELGPAMGATQTEVKVS